MLVVVVVVAAAATMLSRLIKFHYKLLVIGNNFTFSISF
jgi:hypothetical protein